MSSLLLGAIVAAIVVAAEVARRKPVCAMQIAVATGLIALRPAWNIARTYVENVTHFQEWDFLCFWLYGRSLAFHLDPYGARSLGLLALPSAVDDEFRQEVLQVGVPYPPWSLALFAPLGIFSDPHRAAALWCAIEFAALLGAIAVIVCWKSPTANRFAVVAALVLFLPPSLQTAILAQTIPAALLFVALYVLRIERMDGGIWLAAAAVIKPSLLLLLLVPIARRQWRQVLASLATLVAMSAVGVLLAGPAVLLDYIRENPVPRMPGSVITEPNNVPIVAYVLRWMHVVPVNGATLPPSLVALDLVLFVVGISVAWLALKTDAVLAACTLLTVALLVYPQTGAHYAVLLAVPLVVLWRHPRFVDRPGVFAALVFVVYALLGLAGGTLTMFASLLVWVACATACISSRRSLRSREIAHLASAPAGI